MNKSESVGEKKSLLLYVMFRFFGLGCIMTNRNVPSHPERKSLKYFSSTLR